MAVNYTEEQLNSVDKSFLIQLLLQQQEQLEAITKELHASNEKMQLLMEQVILGKQNRFGRSSEKMAISMKKNLMSWNSNLQNSQSVRERKNQIFPDLRSEGLTIICQRRNWK